MLRIAIHNGDGLCRLELAGRLDGPWVAETEKAWRASLRSDRKMEMDLRQLTGIDDAGRDLLAAIQSAGACLIVEGVWLRALIGDLAQRPCNGTTAASPENKHRRGPAFHQQERKNK